MYIRKFEGNNSFLKREAVKLVFQSPIVIDKVDVQFRLKKKFTSIDIVEPEEPRFQLPVDNEAQNST